jgi:tetratricopeptide (TPR) repeat protein
MCLWGEAWAMGPTINFGVEPERKKQAAELAARAAILAEGGPEKERLLTAALKPRYDPALGKGADLAFAKAMDGVAARYPTDNEIAVLTADAWMIAQPSDRKAQNHAMALLAQALKRNPDDTGAIHFYIHVTEFAGVPAYALPYAKRLGELAPAAAHLVHMPAHTFIHVGLYQAAADANTKASAADKAFLAEGGSGQLWKESYHAHNVTFGLGGAMLSGDAKSALAFAEELDGPAKALDPQEPWPQLYSAKRYFAYGRWAEPDRVLAMADPGAKFPYARAMWRYARGEALARKGDAAAVLAEARAMQPTDAELATLGASRGQAEHLIAIAHAVLQGRAAMLQGRWAQAADAFRAAAAVQDANLKGWDPPAWWYPVRRSLAEAELRAGRVDQAEADARAVLAAWAADPVAERVLAEIERARGRTAEADALMHKAQGEWRGDLAALRPADV